MSTPSAQSSTSESPVRYGVIGSGMMGVEHINNIAAVHGAELVAVADTNSQSLDWARLAVGEDRSAQVRYFESHTALLASGRCDAVVIATPNMTHIDVLRDVLATDTHVLVEKPLCVTVAECQEAIALAAAGPANRVAWMGLEYRYMPATSALLGEVRNGTVGQVRMVAIREHRFPFLRKVDNWNRFTHNTGGTLVEKCCHFFDLMSLIMGDHPLRVMASGGQDLNHLDERYDGRTPDILDNAYVVVEYPSGRRAALDLCMFAEASKYEQEVSVVGSLGKLEALIPEGTLRIGRRADGIGKVDERPIVDGNIGYQGFHHGASYLEHVNFVAAIRSGTQAGVTLEDGMWSVAVGAAAHRSIEEHRWVELEEVFTP